MPQQPLHIFIGTVYPRYTEMSAERVQRLHEHNLRIQMLHDFLSTMPLVTVTNPLDSKKNRTSDIYPSIHLKAKADKTANAEMTEEDETVDTEMVERENARRHEVIRQHISTLYLADLAIIDLTYLEDSLEIAALMRVADELSIPTLYIRFGKSTSGPQRSTANEHRFVASYENDFELRVHVNDAIEMLFPYSRREDETNPQIPSKILAFQKKKGA